MSRVNRIDLWNRYFMKETGLCLCCKKAILIRDDETTWHKGHILGDKDRGTGCMDNLWPICVGCNNTSKPFTSIYTYMAYIGTMSLEKATMLEREHRLYLAKCAMGEVDFKCLGYNKNGKRCSFNRISQFCCRKHSSEEQLWITKYMEQNNKIIPMDESNDEFDNEFDDELIYIDDGRLCPMDTSL